jgi:hypothetical protein
VHRFDRRFSAFRATALLIGGYLVLAAASTALLHPELRGAERPATAAEPG